MITVIVFLLVLSVLVLAHELGHFSVARRFGIRIEEFGLGFPPRAVGWYKNKFGKRVKVSGTRTFASLEESENQKLHPKKGATIYSLNWLPLGGFVKIKGQDGDNKNDEDSFAAKPIYQRALVLVAGVVMNIVLAWFLFSIGYMIGLPQTTNDLGKRARVSEQSVLVADVLADSPAAVAGLEAGDKILAVEGLKITTESGLQEVIGNRGDMETEILINRNGEEKTILANPKKSNDRAVIGISIFAAGKISYPFFSALTEGAKTTTWTLEAIVLAFIGLFRDMFSGVSVGDQFAGPIGIANITGQAARMGLVYLLQFMALLSLNLAVLNILPFPALDGGRLLFLLIEKLKGSPVRKTFENLMNNLGFLLLILLIIFITVKDVIKLF
ncbi:RIP metalloprotease RseP [Candidatus Falkowbacteria bacterium]|nr:RIP metalloprotease RseP [Candidatus Falkowbacteria bacterium]